MSVTLDHFFAHLVYSANPFVPDPSGRGLSDAEAIKPRRPLFVAWNGREASPSRSLARACPDPTLAAGISKLDEDEEEKRRAWGSNFCCGFILSSVQVEADRQPRISAEYISVAPRKCDLLGPLSSVEFPKKTNGSLQNVQKCGYLKKPPRSSAKSGTASTRYNSIINEAVEQRTQFSSFFPAVSWVRVKNRSFVLEECRLYPTQQFLRPIFCVSLVIDMLTCQRQIT